MFLFSAAPRCCRVLTHAACDLLMCLLAPGWLSAGCSASTDMPLRHSCNAQHTHTHFHFFCVTSLWFCRINKKWWQFHFEGFTKSLSDPTSVFTAEWLCSSPLHRFLNVFVLVTILCCICVAAGRKKASVNHKFMQVWIWCLPDQMPGVYFDPSLLSDPDLVLKASGCSVHHFEYLCFLWNIQFVCEGGAGRALPWLWSEGFYVRSLHCMCFESDRCGLDIWYCTVQWALPRSRENERGREEEIMMTEGKFIDVVFSWKREDTYCTKKRGQINILDPVQVWFFA